MSLELKVLEKEIGSLSINYDELKKELELKLEQFKGIIVTEETIAENKQVRANLNKVAKTIDDRRKELKAEFLKPYEIVEKQAKELTTMINQVNLQIDTQLKSFEELEKQAKEQEIINLWSSLNFNKVSLKQLWDDRYLNKGFSLAKVEEDLKSKIDDINKNLSSIDMLVKDADANLRIKAKYLQFLDLNLVLNQYEQEKAKEEMLKVAVEEVKEKTTEEEYVEELILEELVQEEEPVYTLTFEVIATKDKIKALSEFLKANKYEYRKL